MLLYLWARQYPSTWQCIKIGDIKVYRTVIVDNESEQAELLYQRVSGSPYAGELDIVRIEDITALLQGDLDPVREADILLCDICLQDGSGAPTGIDLVEQLAPDNGMQIVYVTGYDGYHTSVYRTDHTYFLTKPIQQADMDNALKRCLDRLRQHAEQPPAPEIRRHETGHTASRDRVRGERSPHSACSHRIRGL